VVNLLFKSIEKEARRRDVASIEWNTLWSQWEDKDVLLNYGYKLKELRGWILDISGGEKVYRNISSSHKRQKNNAEKKYKVGCFGDIAIFSLTKNTLNCGGGMFCTNSDIFHRKARLFLIESTRRSILQRLKNFYSILNYGYKTTIDKVVFDRVGKSVFKWWLIDIPDIFPGFIFKRLRFIKQFIKRTNRREISFYNVEKENIGKMQPLSNLRIPLIVASVGRIQLKKIDQFNIRRIKIVQEIEKQLPNYYRNFWENGLFDKNVYSFFPLV
jgi:hypothetical protein